MKADDFSAINEANRLLPDRIIFHIGMTKAGSTAIQNILDKNRDELAARNILFPVSVFSRINPYFQERTSGHFQLIRDLVKGGLGKFLEELKADDGKSDLAVFSAENILFDVDDDALSLLAGLFHGKNLELISIVRRQDQWIPSRYYESVVKGHKKETCSLSEFVETAAMSGRLNYKNRIEYVAKSLHANTVNVINYDAKSSDGGLVGEFLRHLGIESELPAQLSDDERNVSFPFAEGIEAHRRLNLTSASLPSQDYMAWCGQLERAFDKKREQRGIRSQHLRLGRDQLKLLLSECQDANAALSQAYLDGAAFGPTEAVLNAAEPEPIDEGLVLELIEIGLSLLTPFVEGQRKTLEQQRKKAALAKDEAKFATEQSAEFRARLDKALEAVGAAISEVSESRKALTDAEGKADKLRTTAQEELASLRRELDGKLAEQTSKAQDALASLARAEAENAQLERVREDLLDLKRELEAKLAAQTAETQAALVSLAKAEADNAQLERAREDLLQQLSSMKNKASALESDRKEAQAEAARQAAENEKLRSREKSLDLALSEERERRQQLEFELNARIQEVEAYRTSTSWRLTAPMRGVVTLLRAKPAGVRQAAIDKPDNANTMGVSAGGAGHALRSKRGELNERALKDARHHVQQLKVRLLTLGFHERAVEDFNELIASTTDAYKRSLAAWEMAVWRANRATPEDAEDCLRLLDIVAAENAGPDQARFIAILQAECHAVLGQREQAARILKDRVAVERHADIYLGCARLEEAPQAKLDWINRALTLHGLETAAFVGPEDRPLYDRLHAEAPPAPESEMPGAPKVSVIIPCFNAEETIETTIRALQAQSWRNLEILVSDDCSTDRVCAVVEACAAEDARIRLIRAEKNAGPYVARNLALLEATGDYVTTTDSDDWSHPRKIEIQARHLRDHPDAVANTSPQARTSEDLAFHRRGNAGFYLQPNMSSLMFRRELVVGKIGYWDSVRFAADSEFTRRIKAAFGKSAIVDLDVGPLMFQRQTPTSLTGSDVFGYHGFKMGARREYEEAHKRFHASSKKLYVPFPLADDERPFPVPEPMRPNRVTMENGRRRFDVVIASDFRLPGGSNMSNIEEIKAQKRMGLRTGLVQMGRYDVNPSRSINPKVIEHVDGQQVEMLVYGERVACDLLIVRLPWVLQEWQEYIPDIDAKAIRVIVNQPPKRDYGPGSEPIYNINRCAMHLQRYFGGIGAWHPIGPLVRDALTKHHAEEIAGLPIGDDWHNIIDIGEWRRPLRSQRLNRIRICRHSRDQYVKWPSDREELLKIYPDSEEFEVHILGGAETPKEVLGGGLPKYWRVTEFGKIHPRDFLSKFDVFVYFTHPDWVESFGRVIFEAMAVGLPVVLPEIYRPLFGDAAIYATPDEVQDKIRALMDDEHAYEAQVARALSYVEANFGYRTHARRIGEAMERDLSASISGSPLDRSELSLKGDAAALSSFDPAALAKVRTVMKSAGQSKAAALARTLLADADEAMERPAFSVTDKSTLPPSGDIHDYWHPAPYWHPNPDSVDGLPYIRKDGMRVPGTIMYEPESTKYDRTRLQHLFDDSTILALTWKLTGNRDYAVRAAGHLRRWFIDPATRMNPHLEFAQVKMGHNKNRGSSSGIIEMKDLYYYLDAVRLLSESEALSDDDEASFKSWLQIYVRWLRESRQGIDERAAKNNHGLYYDLQVAAIAAYLDQRPLLFSTLRDSRERIAHHFAPDGSQPEELTRTTTAHYCCFNLQGWMNLATLAERWGVDLWGYQGPGGQGLKAGASWLLSFAGEPWPYEQIDEFDAERFIPIWFSAPKALRPARPKVIPASADGVKPRFYPHDGIRPYWNFVL